MPTTRITVSMHGKLFTGEYVGELNKFKDDAKETVADVGVTEVRARLGSVLRNPTGYYQSQIQTQRARSFNDMVVTDGGVRYGAWLESGKYTPPRRFSGYSTFNRVRAQLRKQLTSLVQSDLDRLIMRLNL